MPASWKSSGRYLRDGSEFSLLPVRVNEGRAAPAWLCPGLVLKRRGHRSCSEKVACRLGSASVARGRNPGAPEWRCWSSTLFSFLCDQRDHF